jgi:acetolactate synthase I/II/III large subunit
MKNSLLDDDTVPTPPLEAPRHERRQRPRASLLSLPADPTPSEASLAERLVLDLARQRIDTYFGVPGGPIEPLFNALARQQRAGRVRLITMRSEAGAAFAADGHYRAVGRAAVCTGTTGPGIGNLITGVMAAHADRIPMVVITPQVSRAKEGRGALQDSSSDGYDMTRVLGEFTRYSTSISHPDQLPHKLTRALLAMEGSPPGPVHLSIASDILSGPQPARSLHPAAARAASARAVHDPTALAELVAAVTRAKAPVFYVGDDAGPDAPALLPLARALDGCVISSPAGKHWIGHRDPFYRGVLGFSGHQAAAAAVGLADVIVAFGATFDELSTNAWSAFGSVDVFAVDTHLEHLHRLPTARPVLASTARVIQALADVKRRRRAPTGKSARGIERRAPMAKGRATGGPLDPADLMAWLNRKLPEDVVVYVDAGNSFAWSTHLLLRPRPSTYRVAMGLSTMCWALGAVVGAAVASSRRTICIVGDGSMLMSGLELTVAVQEQLPITYLVLNDSSLGMVRHGQQMSGAEPIAFELGHVEFNRIAEACGARAFRVHDARQLELVPDACLADDAGGPTLIEAMIDRDAVPPMLERVRGLNQGVSR